MTRPTDLKEGEILAGKYRVERVLAQGGMGVVVAAIHQQLEQRVALKFLLPEGVQNEAHVARFVREARAAVRLRSEHVARVLDVGTSETGSPYIVMEYLEGHDLADLLAAEGALPVHTAVGYILQACEAVAEAHANGIIHRDLKPANLFLTKRADGTPCIKVLDFGISKQRSAVDPSMTSTQAIMGTPMYMSPEQMLSSKSVDARSDIWALGMVLYELLTGRVAFVRETLPELCAAILNHAPPSLVEARSEIGPQLERVVMRALERNPEDRFGSLAEMASALAPFARTGAEATLRIHRILGLGAPHVSDAPPPAEVTTPPLLINAPASAIASDVDEAPTGLPRRPRAAIVIAAVALAALLCVGAFGLVRGRGPAPVASSAPPTLDSIALPAVAPAPVSAPPPVLAQAPPSAVRVAEPSATRESVNAASSGARPRAPAPRAHAPAPPSNPDDLGPRK